MGGYRTCKSCGRRFLASDDNEYCSPSCFSLESTVEERRPSRLVAAVPVVAVLLLLFFAFEDLTINYWFLQNLPLLESHALAVFDEAGHAGVLFLHERLATAPDDEIVPLLTALASCRGLGDYQWRSKLVQELDGWYDEAGPDLRRAIIRLFGSAEMVPLERSFLVELNDPDMQDEILAMCERVRSPQFVGALAEYVQGRQVSAATASRVVNILQQTFDPQLANARLVAWMAEHGADSLVRREAIMALPKILWPPATQSHGGKGSDNFIESFKTLQRIMAGHDDHGLRDVARQAIEQGRKKRQAFVEFDALKVFDEAFE